MFVEITQSTTRFLGEAHQYDMRSETFQCNGQKSYFMEPAWLELYELGTEFLRKICNSEDTNQRFLEQ